MAPVVAERSVEHSGEKLDEDTVEPASPMPTLVDTERLDALPTSLPVLGEAGAERPEAEATPPHAASAPCGVDSPPPAEPQLAVPAADESEQLRLRMRGRALQELLSTEVSYLLHLHRLANLFVLPLRGDLPQTGCVDISQSGPAASASPSPPHQTGIHAALPLPDPLVLPPRLASTAPAGTVVSVGATPLGSPGGRRNSTSSVASTESGGVEAVPPSLLSVEQVGRLLTPFEHSRIFGGVDGLIPLHTTLLQELAAALRAGHLLTTPAGDGFHAADACPRAAAAAETCESPPAPELALAEGSAAAESLSSPAPEPAPAPVPVPDEVCVGAVFLRLCPFLRMYSRYAEGQGAAGAEVRARMTHTRLPLMGASGSGAGSGSGGGSGADEASDDACERDAQYASQVWNLAAALRLQACASPRPSPGVSSVAPINCATPVAGGVISPAAAPRSRFSLGFGAASRESRDSGGVEEEREREKAAAAGAKQQRRQLAAVRAVPVSFPRFVRVMESDPAARGQSLASLLAMPIQRVPRYALLLKEILKHTPPGHPDHAALTAAVEQVVGAATRINTAIAQHEVQLRVMQVQLRLQPAPEPSLVAPHREFVREGLLQKVCRPFKLKPYTFLLFNDLVVYGQASGGAATASSSRGGAGAFAFSRGTASASAEPLTPVAGAHPGAAGSGGSVKVHQIVTLLGVQELQWAADMTGAKLAAQQDSRSRLQHAFVVLGQPKSFIAVASSAVEKAAWVSAISDCLGREDERRRSKGLPALSTEPAANVHSGVPGLMQ